jgi:hypothetical protein
VCPAAHGAWAGAVHGACMCARPACTSRGSASMSPGTEGRRCERRRSDASTSPGVSEGILPVRSHAEPSRAVRRDHTRPEQPGAEPSGYAAQAALWPCGLALMDRAPDLAQRVVALAPRGEQVAPPMLRRAALVHAVCRTRQPAKQRELHRLGTCCSERAVLRVQDSFQDAAAEGGNSDRLSL